MARLALPTLPGLLVPHIGRLTLALLRFPSLSLSRRAGRPRTQLSELPAPLFPGYVGRLCAVPAPGVGERYTVSVPGEGACEDGESPRLPNPTVRFYNRSTSDNDALAALFFAENASDANASASSIVLDLSGGRNEPRDAGGLPDQVLVHADPIPVDGGCPDPARLTGADGRVRADVFGIDANGTWWIHDPTLALRDNTRGPIDNRASTGGDDGVTPLCASAPPTYLNEGRCFFAGETTNATENSTAATAATCATRDIYCPGDEGEGPSDPFSEFAFSVIKDGTKDRVSPRNARKETMHEYTRPCRTLVRSISATASSGVRLLLPSPFSRAPSKTRWYAAR